MRIERTIGQHTLEHRLVEIRRTEIVVPLHVQHARQPLRRGADPVANFQPRRERLGERAGVEFGKRVPLGKREQARRTRGAVERHLPVGGVLERGHDQPVRRERAREAAFLLRVERTAGGVREKADHVHGLHAPRGAVAPHPRQQRVERRQVEPPVDADRQRTRLDPQPAQHLEKHEIARAIHEHDVARVAQRLHGEIERLLRTVGDEHARRIHPVRGPTLLVRQALREQAPQAGPPLVGAVLQRLRRAAHLRERGDRTPERLDGQRGVVGEARREREQLRILQRRRHEAGDDRRRRAPAESGEGDRGRGAHAER